MVAATAAKAARSSRTRPALRRAGLVAAVLEQFRNLCGLDGGRAWWLLVEEKTT
jgi:hypothetical protein